MLLKSDVERIKKTGGKCPFVAKKCDGLCNNCGLDIVPENNHRIVPARNWWNQNDYEGVILARQENMDFQEGRTEQ